MRPQKSAAKKQFPLLASLPFRGGLIQNSFLNQPLSKHETRNPTSQNQKYPKGQLAEMRTEGLQQCHILIPSSNCLQKDKAKITRSPKGDHHFTKASEMVSHAESS
jgi:hypothetical protein